MQDTILQKTAARHDGDRPLAVTPIKHIMMKDNTAIPGKDISIVVSLFNENESLGELVGWIRDVMHRSGFNYEIIMIDDGSTDGSWETIKRLSNEAGDIRAIHSDAITASLPHFTADSRLQRARLSSQWTPTCRIPLKKSRKCTG